MNTGFLGRDGFIWFVGVVEDRHDPEKLGRVKVRALGYHTEDKQKIQTAELPWAEVMQPTGANAMAGIGDSPIGIVEGTWVCGFFRDPASLQEPIIMGTLPGRNVKTAKGQNALGKHRGQWVSDLMDFEYGFHDPTNSHNIPSQPFAPAEESYKAQSSTVGAVTTISKDEDVKVRTYKEVEEGVFGGAGLLTPGVGSASTHSDALTNAFTTTRRVTTDKNVTHSYGKNTPSSDVTRDPTGKINTQIISTGYLEDGDTRSSNELHGPNWPKVTELHPELKHPFPRVETVKVSSLTPTQKEQIKQLFDEGVYGEKEWKDVKASDTVVIPRADTNRLARGGYRIASISGGGTIQLKDWGRKSTPPIQSGDHVQISGVIGMEQINGVVFPVTSVNLTTRTIVIASSLFSKGEYVSGGVVLPEPHAVLTNKANTREKQINIGGEDLGDGVAGGGSYTAKWNQPTSRYAAEYPYNKVYESESGHIKEYDDTPGGERIHEYHRSGTYYEVDQYGTKVDYVKGDRYNISVHDDYLYVKGKVIWTGDDDMLITSNDNMSLSSKWRLKVASGGDIEVYSKRNINMRAEGDINMIAGGHVNIEAEVQDNFHPLYKHQAGSRNWYTLGRINMVAGTIEMIAPDPKAAALLAKNESAGRISMKAQHKITSSVTKGAYEVEVEEGDMYFESWSLGTIQFHAGGGAGKHIKFDIDIGDIAFESLLGEIYGSASGHISFKPGGDFRADAFSGIELRALGSAALQSTGGSVDISSAGSTAISAAGVASITGSIVALGGAQILLNSGGTIMAASADPATIPVTGDLKLSDGPLGPDLMGDIILFNKDEVKTGNIGQGSPLGINDEGDNIRIYRTAYVPPVWDSTGPAVWT